MKILILTQPLKTNYGGILQAYALQTVLKNIGHDVITADLPMPDSFFNTITIIAKRIVLKYVFQRKDISNIKPIKPTIAENKKISEHIRPFIKKHIRLTETIRPVNKIKLLENKYDVFIVGSDQVWRRYYSPSLPVFFLQFLDDNRSVKRIAYAASFGVDFWEYNEKLTELCKNLIAKFDAVSVREESAIHLCNKYFDANPVCVLDPTLLLDKDDYSKLLNDKFNSFPTTHIFAYILDRTSFTHEVIEKIHEHLGFVIYDIMPKSKYSPNCAIHDCVFSSVEDWIGGFMNAKFVITDSFHGVIFSIIFNKEFIALGNEIRGMARFSSLLKIFDLKDRLVTTSSDLSKFNFEKKIDWKNVNLIKEEWQGKSLNFIHNSLK